MNNTAANLRRQDTTKGPPLRILSLDGGGVRGYSMMIILQELMHRTYVESHGRAPRPEEIPKPCDHFDLIAGTGTGGLIAIMLGRLRLDLETCKEVYIRMTKRVFETDKTFAGIPYRSTLFKASKLEEAIRDCVREHTVYEDEGNDTLANATPMTPDTPGSIVPDRDSISDPRRSLSTTSRASVNSPTPFSPGLSVRPTMHGAGRWGNPNAYMYDVRENRTKTAVTATYKGAKKGDKAVFLRSYDSRREPAPEVNCTIWQAGRATSATGLAFKPIQIGQSVFIDEGAGRFNPSPQVLDEAVINEYPSRDIGVFISIGTGKRPPNTNQRQGDWWEGFMGGSASAFAEARRRLIAKIEGCEETHQFVRSTYLAQRGVDPDNYYRLNVEVGVGEFGMNEWSRLSDISTNTRRYLAKEDVQRMNLSAARKIAKIHHAKIRWDRANGISPPGSRPYSFVEGNEEQAAQGEESGAIELPAEVPQGYTVPPYPQTPYPQTPYPQQRLASNPSAAQSPQQPPQDFRPPNPQFHHQVHRPSYDDKIPVDMLPEDTPPIINQQINPDDRILPQNYAPIPNSHHSAVSSQSSFQHQTQSQPPISQQQQQQSPSQHHYRSSPPPLPPKTPISSGREGQYLHRPPDPRNPRNSPGSGNSPRVSGESSRPGPHYHPMRDPPALPDRSRGVPSGDAVSDLDEDGPPPMVDMSRKPKYGMRYAS